MIIRSDDMKRTLRENIRGGTGQAVLTELIAHVDLPEACRIAATLELAPGCSIGRHEHVGEAEIYYCISGTGLLDDNGAVRPFAAGDVSVTYSGEYHGVTNTGEGKLELFAFVIKN